MTTTVVILTSALPFIRLSLETTDKSYCSVMAVQMVTVNCGCNLSPAEEHERLTFLCSVGITAGGQMRASVLHANVHASRPFGPHAWNYIIGGMNTVCVGVRICFHGNWPRGQGRCMFARLIPPMLTDHNIKMEPIFPFMGNNALPVYIHPSCHSSSWDFPLELSISKSCCLTFLFLFSQKEKQLTEIWLKREYLLILK